MRTKLTLRTNNNMITALYARLTSILTYAILVSILFPFSQSASAQTYPDKPVTLIIPFSAGGSHDINARVLTSVIPGYLGQPMIVKLMPGGGGQRGVAATVAAQADGYTLLFGHNFLDQLQPVITKLNYEPLEDLITVWKLNDSVPVMYVREDSPFSSAPELVEHARKNPGQMVFPSSGKWGFSFTVGSMLFAAEDMQVRNVPYKGGGPVKAAILSGDGDFAFAPFSSVRELYRSGKVRILAVAGPDRLDGLADIPSFAELGYPSSGTAMERIVMAPAAIPDDRLKTLREAFSQLYQDPSFLRLMRQLGENTNALSGEKYESIRHTQREEYRQLAKKLLQ